MRDISVVTSVCLVEFWLHVSDGHAGDAGVCGEEVDDAGVVFDGPGDLLHVVGVVGVCPAVLGAAEV